MLYPEYPAGTYAYFVTNDATGTPVYPYVVGTSYYGVVQSGNTGPASGHNTVPSGAVIYNPVTGVTLAASKRKFNLYPQPAGNRATLTIAGDSSDTHATLTLTDMLGRQISAEEVVIPAAGYTFNTEALSQGNYKLSLVTPAMVHTLTLLKD